MSWLDIYKKRGLWGCFASFAQENHIRQWGIFINFTHYKCYIGSDGRPQKKDYKQGDQIKIHQDNLNRYEILIPVGMQKNILFIWHLLSEVALSQQEIHQMKFQIELLLLYEGCNTGLYPTFLPFLYPNSDCLSTVNELLYRQKTQGLVFLNAQKGSGKASFAQCFILLHLKHFLNFNSMKEKINYISIETPELKSILYIPELALLTYSEQFDLIQILQNEKNALVIIASAYALDVLFNNHIILKDMFFLCQEKRIIIPSLRKRYPDISAMIDFLCRSKINMKALSSQGLKYNDNLDGLKKSLSAEVIHEARDDNNNSIKLDLSSLENNQSLRDMIAKLEIASIQYAHEKVGDSQNNIADFLGISRGSLQHKLKKYNIDYINL